MQRQSLLLDWNQSINYSKVVEIKKNALDWNKVNELLREVLSDKNIMKIKSCTNTAQKQKFVELAEWIKSHSTNRTVIRAALNKYYDGKKQENKHEWNKYAWYNNPKKWDSFAGWAKELPDFFLLITLPILLLIYGIYGIYRLIAFIVRDSNK